MPVPVGLCADSLARVRVYDLPKARGAGGRGNFPQQIVTGGCPQFAIASGLHVQAGRHAACLPPCRRQLKLRGPYGGETDAPQLMPVVMGPQRGGRRECELSRNLRISVTKLENGARHFSAVGTVIA